MHGIFVSDIHGRIELYEELFKLIEAERPEGVFFGGDLLPADFTLPGGGGESRAGFIHNYLIPEFQKVKASLGAAYPCIFVILGNDDPRTAETDMLSGEQQGLWQYLHNRKATWGGFSVYGYSCVPPTPFMLKDWERYDVSRYTDPGCIAPEAGWRTVRVPDADVKYGTIIGDLDGLVAEADVQEAIFLFHTPPYQTSLDRAGLNGKQIEGAQLDVHVGSIAVRKFIEERQPLLTLHGHIHESARLTGAWLERIGGTVCVSAAHDGEGLAVVRFSPGQPEQIEREILSVRNQ